MPYDSTLHRCAHPGCTHWALYNDAACAVHAGFVPAPAAAGRPKFPLAGGTEGGPSPLDPPPTPNPAHQLALVIAHRDSLDRFIRLSLGYRTRPFTEELAYLRLLSGLAKDLITALSRRSGTAAADEIDRFLDEVAREARESPHWHTDDPYGLGPGWDRVKPPSAAEATPQG